MNIFQRQLILNDGRTLTERCNSFKARGYEISLAPPQQRISVEEFERDVRAARKERAMKTKGANGPLTLRCPKCGTRNVGDEHPIRALGEYSYRSNRRGARNRLLTGVQCLKCEHVWQTTHRSVRLPEHPFTRREGAK